MISGIRPEPLRCGARTEVRSVRQTIPVADKPPQIADQLVTYKTQLVQVLQSQTAVAYWRCEILCVAQIHCIWWCVGTNDEIPLGTFLNQMIRPTGAAMNLHYLPLTRKDGTPVPDGTSPLGRRPSDVRHSTPVMMAQTSSEVFAMCCTEVS